MTSSKYKSPYGPIWPLINSRDRNRVYEILERCDAAPNWFQDDANGIIENLKPRELIRLLRYAEISTQVNANDVQMSASGMIAAYDQGMWLDEAGNYIFPGEENLEQVKTQKLIPIDKESAKESEQQSLKEWMDCYLDISRILRKVENRYKKQYGKLPTFEREGYGYGYG